MDAIVEILEKDQGVPSRFTLFCSLRAFIGMRIQLLFFSRVFGRVRCCTYL
jgi:hypothetical protein